jgi:hypothetical protein
MTLPSKSSEMPSLLLPMMICSLALALALQEMPSPLLPSAVLPLASSPMTFPAMVCPLLLLM